jgi:solute carrier family 8 (sodium/calcium exchanger)
VNVFLGLGLPWTISASYHAWRGTKYIVPSGPLSFVIALFCGCAVVAIAVLFVRRSPRVAGGEIGGPRCLQLLTFGFFIALFLMFIVVSLARMQGAL